jgi:hypothetical protein
MAARRDIAVSYPTRAENADVRTDIREPIASRKGAQEMLARLAQGLGRSVEENGGAEFTGLLGGRHADVGQQEPQVRA